MFKALTEELRWLWICLKAGLSLHRNHTNGEKPAQAPTSVVLPLVSDRSGSTEGTPRLRLTRIQAQLDGERARSEKLAHAVQLKDAEIAFLKAGLEKATKERNPPRVSVAQERELQRALIERDESLAALEGVQVKLGEARQELRRRSLKINRLEREVEAASDRESSLAQIKATEDGLREQIQAMSTLASSRDLQVKALQADQARLDTDLQQKDAALEREKGASERLRRLERELALTREQRDDWKMEAAQAGLRVSALEALLHATDEISTTPPPSGGIRLNEAEPEETEPEGHHADPVLALVLAQRLRGADQRNRRNWDDPADLELSADELDAVKSMVANGRIDPSSRELAEDRLGIQGKL